LGLLIGWEVAGQNAVVRGPFLQNVTTNSIQVIWRTVEPSGTVVEYGPTASLGLAINSEVLETNHVVTLTGLLPGTSYSYRIRSDNEQSTLTTGVETFRTLKTEGAIRFTFISDTAGGNSITRSLAAMMKKCDPDLTIHGGDHSGVGTAPAQPQSEFFDPFQPVMSSIPFFMVPGNHDVAPSYTLDSTVFEENFYLPTNSANGSELFYSFDHGDVHFVCLFNPWNATFVLDATTVEYAWLTNDLAQSTKPWKLLFSHLPAATTAYHARNNYNGGLWDSEEFLQLLAPLARQYGVQLVLSGHDHNAQRFAPTNGLHSLVNSSGGQTTYAFSTMHPALAQFVTANAFTRISVTNDTLWVETVGVAGTVLDSMVIQRTLPTDQIYESAWNSPAFPTNAPNDGDGNIYGQRLGFVGKPLYPRSGQFSNLGQVFVNHDTTNLYLGFQQAMFYSNNNVFVFIESPRLAGVSNMAGLGNGVLDPEGQGVDGLDCLENLSFEGFSPAIAGVLGDEYADGQYRGFLRTNMDFSTGQGLFRLDSAIGDVPGARLQQFNRSPHSSVPNAANRLEQNADFMMMSIPLAELGGIGVGDVIRVGAVVGGSQWDGVGQTRELDEGALGVSFSGAGQGAATLTGVRVQLAGPPGIWARITPPVDNHVRLSWNAEVGLSYAVEAAVGSLSNFVQVGTVTATNAEAVYPIRVEERHKAIYRIRQP
jgi:predicted phosphodiesterase